MFRTKRFLATAVAICTLSTSATTLVGTPATPVANAAAATSISGTVTNDGAVAQPH